jgi:hypothetical protein
MVLVTCGDTVTYVQAWEYWASGRPDNGCLVLWGLSLRWWGRIGQLVAFSGSLLVVADIVDLAGLAESFRDARASFKRAATAAWERRYSVIVISALILFAAENFLYGVIYGPDELERLRMCYAGDMWVCSLAEGWSAGLRVLPLLVLVFGGGIGTVLLFAFIVGYVVPEIILMPLAGLLRILPRWTKVLNLLLIIVAFHFNLLAS